MAEMAWQFHQKWGFRVHKLKAGVLRVAVACFASGSVSVSPVGTATKSGDAEASDVDLRGSYLHLKGLVAEKANDNGVYVKRASHNVIEQVVSRYNGDSGVQVEDGSAYNLLLNVDSYGNYDAGNHGETADGFAIKFGVGPGNVLRGCRAWGNSDDGYDFWSRDDPGQEGVLVEDSWAFENGHNVWGGASFQGDSNGFKLGHGPGPHVLVGVGGR